MCNLWWSFKAWFGSLSDCHPILGYRRRPYILLGWCVALLFSLVLIGLGQPFFGASEWQWIMCLFAINIGYIMADVATDSVMTDLAQREPLAERGQLQTTYYIVRAITGALTSGVVSFGFSSKEYGGSFSWGFTLPQYVWITVALASMGLVTFYRLKEKHDPTTRSMIEQFQHFFRRLELDAVWRVTLFIFCVNFLTSLHNNTFYDVAKDWCGDM